MTTDVSRYNILLITDDQHRADCLGVAGHPVVQTPHLDQLAYEGVRFRAAYSECPICIPARCSLISGLHASTYKKPSFFREQPVPIDRSRTLMALLTQAGYQTQAVGKMHFYPHRARYGFENMILDLDYVEWLEKETPYRGAASFMGRGLGLNEFWPVPAPMPAAFTSTPPGDPEQHFVFEVDVRWMGVVGGHEATGVDALWQDERGRTLDWSPLWQWSHADPGWVRVRGRLANRVVVAHSAFRIGSTFRWRRSCSSRRSKSISRLAPPTAVTPGRSKTSETGQEDGSEGVESIT